MTSSFYFRRCPLSDQTAARVERDSLGEVLVPQDALYGAQTQRAVLNFPISGLKAWRAFIWSMAIIKRAAADVHKDLGLLDEQRASAIATAAAEIRKRFIALSSRLHCPPNKRQPATAVPEFRECWQFCFLNAACAGRNQMPNPAAIVTIQRNHRVRRGDVVTSMR